MVLTNLPAHSVFDLPPWVGQRQSTFRYVVTNSVTGEERGEITPLRSASISHDVARTIKRQLNLSLGIEDTSNINSVQDRVRVSMVLPDGSEYPLGTFMFNSATENIFTSGNLGNYTLSDEMFKVDQQIEQAVGRQDGQVIMPTCESLVNQVLAGQGVAFTVEPSPFATDQGWAIGSYRGQVAQDLSVTGDWFSPWFDSTNVMRFIRTFEPGDRIPDFDWDAGNQVLREGIVQTGNLLTVPNRFVVVGNTTTTTVDSGGSQVQSGAIPVVGTYDVPSSYPYSLANRGFTITNVSDLPVFTAGQATAAARLLAIRNGAFEQLSVSTALDPRHEAYNVVWWREMAWLETSWTMNLLEGGGNMTHVLRRAYS